MNTQLMNVLMVGALLTTPSVFANIDDFAVSYGPNPHEAPFNIDDFAVSCGPNPHL